MKIGIYIGRINPMMGGESSLTRTILNEIQLYNDKRYEYVFLYTKENGKEKEFFLEGYKFISIDKCCGNKSLLLNGFIESMGGASNRFYKLDRIAKKEGIDFFYFAAPIFAQTSLPYIFTVWDLGHRTTLYFPEVSEKEWGYREKLYKAMLPRATFVVTANDTGKREILKYYQIDEERIKIVPFPVTLCCHVTEKQPEFSVDEPFFFYPAQFWSHKNHIVILDALVELRDKFEQRPMVYFVGGDKGNKHYLEKKVKEYDLEEQVIFTGFVSDEELKYMYMHAKALIFASLLGPNNLPPLEAIYLNCPVIISDIPGHREQMGKGALYFDGYDSSQLANIMAEVLDSPDIVSPIVESMAITKRELEDIVYFQHIIGLFEKMELQFKRWK